MSDKQVVLRPKKKKKSITFAVPNGEASDVSQETQFRAFESTSEDDIDFEDNNNNGNDDNSVTSLTNYGDDSNEL